LVIASVIGWDIRPAQVSDRLYFYSSWIVSGRFANANCLL